MLFLDTAAILDISRVPYRQELQADILDSAIALVDDLLASPRRVWVATTGNVLQEFQAHRNTIEQELESRAFELLQSLSRFSRVAKTVLPERRIAPIEWLDSIFQKRVLGIMDRLIELTSVFRGTGECTGKARDRLWAGIPPASKSKQQFKDCEIFEEFLELTGTLRTKGIGVPAVFVTPNREDYGPPPDGFERIASDLGTAGALYAANIAWARALTRSTFPH